jgi:hypothetical protein
MEHYVTLFDSLFLPQGLALHASLQRHAGPHQLWILCVDEECHRVLSALALPGVRLLALADVETESLRSVKDGRSRGEYCWTLTPFSPGFVFDADPSVQRVTYVDADLWLTADPAPIFSEFDRSGKGVLITEHAYAPDYDHTRTAGKFCVQFMTFVRDRGDVVRHWWAQQCVHWCYARLEDGKFGDQMYLDDWPERFTDAVHVAERREYFQAPWNATRFPASEAKAYHFHGLRLMEGGHALLATNYRLPAPTLSLVYEPYLADLAAGVERLRSAGHMVIPQTRGPVAPAWWRRVLKRAAAFASGAELPYVAKL